MTREKNKYEFNLVVTANYETLYDFFSKRIDFPSNEPSFSFPRPESTEEYKVLYAYAELCWTPDYTLIDGDMRINIYTVETSFGIYIIEAHQHSTEGMPQLVKGYKQNI